MDYVDKFKTLFKVSSDYDITLHTNQYDGTKLISFHRALGPQNSLLVVSVDDFNYLLETIEKYSEVYSFRFGEYDEDKFDFEFFIFRHGFEKYEFYFDFSMKSFCQFRSFFNEMSQLLFENKMLKEMITIENKKRKI